MTSHQCDTFREELQTLCERHGVELPAGIKIAPDGASEFTEEHIKALAGFLRWWHIEDASMEENTLRLCFRPCAKAQQVELTGDPDNPIVHQNINFAEGSNQGPWPLCEIHTDKVLVV